PWIADYRDLWSQDKRHGIIFKNWYTLFEKKIVRTSSSIITVSDFLKNRISILIKNKEILILPNGYDPEAIEDIKDIPQQSDVLSISFIGVIYKWYPVKSFLTEVAHFIRNKKNASIHINFYGINLATELQGFISDDFPELKKHVNIYPKIPNDELLKKLAKDNVMLLFNSYAYAGTKIYDYIGIKRTILLCYTDDDEANKLKSQYYRVKETEGFSNQLQEDLINETNSGYAIKNAAHLRVVLEQLYDEFNKKGYIECHTINAENYSRKHQVKQLATMINNLSYSKKDRNPQ
ncbi:MAG: hypothetical protein H0W84_11145, partial [Bacteroidetes bacterium]|nr:hypothetical protein [Bacteroidota bacterium]